MEFVTQEIALSGVTLEYLKTGHVSPALVFLNGHRIHWNSWKNVISVLPADSLVVAYNRAGVGHSSAAGTVQSGEVIVDQLAGLLDALRVDSPCILIGHSLGGLYTNLFARTYPDRVAAVVLVESGHPAEANNADPQSSGQERGMLARVVGKLESIVGKPKFKRDPFSEFNGVSETVSQLEQANDFPDIPLTVVTGTSKMPFVPEQVFAEHLEWQEQLTHLSTCSVQCLAASSGHVPQLTEPELVASAIIDTVNRI